MGHVFVIGDLNARTSTCPDFPGTVDHPVTEEFLPSAAPPVQSQRHSYLPSMVCVYKSLKNAIHKQPSGQRSSFPSLFALPLPLSIPWTPFRDRVRSLAVAEVSGLVPCGTNPPFLYTYAFLHYAVGCFMSLFWFLICLCMSLPPEPLHEP